MPETAKDDMVCISIPHGDAEELFITARAKAGEDPRALFRRAAAAVHERLATVIHQDVFGVSDKDGKGVQALRAAVGTVDWPVTWLKPPSAADALPGGTCVHAIKGANVSRIRRSGAAAGSVFEIAGNRYCRLGGVAPDKHRLKPEQARSVLEAVETLVKEAGMELHDVARTWLFLDGILEWYGPFNQIRNQFFQERKVAEGRMPASTGVGGPNPSGAAILAGALAVKGPSVQVVSVPSPLQCSAQKYGSAFNRAVEITDAHCRRLLVSGTASIGADGKTAHPGDFEAQAKLTLDVVAAILEFRQMDWQDVVRAVVYLPRSKDIDVLRNYCAKNYIPPLPAVAVNAAICRTDLLFEIEADAVKTESK